MGSFWVAKSVEDERPVEIFSREDKFIFLTIVKYTVKNLRRATKKADNYVILREFS